MAEPQDVHPSDSTRIEAEFLTLKRAVGGAWLTVAGAGIAGVMSGALFDPAGGTLFLIGSGLVVESVLDW